MQTGNEQISDDATETLDRGELDIFRQLLGTTFWVRRAQDVPTTRVAITR
jgi:hypothetical protein